MPRKYTPAEQIAVFWSRVNKDGPTQPHMDTPCWVWGGATIHRRYGRTPWMGSKSEGAHRIAYQLAHGAVPVGLIVLHRCDNPPCCNPAHLWSGTQADNVADMIAKGRHVASSGDANGSRLHPDRLAWGARNGARLHPAKFQGENNGRSKLTANDVREIRAEFAAGASKKGIARKWGVSDTNIISIIRRETWSLVQ